MRSGRVTTMRARRVASALALACGLVVASCDSDRPRASTPAGSPAGDSGSPRVSEQAASPSSDTGPLGVHRPEELVDAAKAVVAFLRGEADFDRIRLADTVTLYLSPEGGGTRSVVAREMLRRPSNWKASSGSLPRAPAMVHSFVPPKGRAELTTRVGSHINCLAYPLSSRSEELARLPHVGTMLMFDEQGGCLHSWNLTLVFDPDERPPTVVAAVYDQWEW
jgi:hypothetical protein